MKQYRITLRGLTPLLMHQDNLGFSEKIKAWQSAPENKAASVKGDDRSPAWVWLGYTYHDGRNMALPSDNIMTMLREGGAKVPTGKGTESFKRQTQAGIMLDTQYFELLVGGRPVPMAPLNALIGNNEFSDHIDAAESLGFELLVKRAKVGQSKHIRVRAMFREWVATGTLTVLDEAVSGLRKDVLQTVLNQAGALVGVGDWRPGSPKSPGVFGRFEPTVEAI